MSETLEPFNKRNVILKRAAIIFASVVLVIAISIASFLVYNNVYYTPFWVNGQSMYPTLNKDAKNKNGELYGESGSSVQEGSYDIDYGFMDNRESAINKIVRFNIIICKYSNDSSDASNKVKRVIALPGETFYISNKSEDNGSLYVANSDGKFELIIQPIDDAIIKKAQYPTKYASAYTLSNNEYFVLGDNRSHSSDSRINGPVTKNLIVGVVKGLNGKAKIGYDENGNNLKPVSVSKYWPRYF